MANLLGLSGSHWFLLRLEVDMLKLVFSSRRAHLSPDQIFDLEKIVGRFTGLGAFDRPFDDHLNEFSLGAVNHVQHWQSTDNASNDIKVNQEIWAKFAKAGHVIAGDFPHVALEALAAWGLNFPVPVYVRVYAIGGGFKRDSKYLRWAEITPNIPTATFRD
jgi:hypothetical protein